MISIVWSKSVGKSNTKYYDVVIKWLNIATLIVNIDKIHTLYYNLVVKSYFAITSTVNICKRYTSYYNVVMFLIIVTTRYLVSN